jgi:hypothetical protein
MISWLVNLKLDGGDGNQKAGSRQGLGLASDDAS